MNRQMNWIFDSFSCVAFILKVSMVLSACFSLADVDECQIHGVCLNGRCLNTVGSYRCLCNPGYIPDPTLTTCICKCRSLTRLLSPFSSSSSTKPKTSCSQIRSGFIFTGVIGKELLNAAPLRVSWYARCVRYVPLQYSVILHPDRLWQRIKYS